MGVGGRERVTVCVCMCVRERERETDRLAKAERENTDHLGRDGGALTALLFPRTRT